MEQLGQVVKFLKQYGFWVACTLCTIMAAGGWYWFTGKLMEEETSNRNKLAGRINQINSIATTNPHPNPASQDQIKVIISDREDKLFKAWELLATKQDGTLSWPEKFNEEYPDIYAQVSAMRPIEAYKGVEVDQPFLTLYRDYHRELFEPMADKIGAKWAPSGGGDPTAGGLNRDLGNSLVDWLPSNQTEILSNHFTWFGDGGIPQTAEMLYAQEDLWVLDSIMETIARTNGNIDSRHKASIKTIEYIRLGKNVEPRSGTVKIKTRDGMTTEATELAAPEAPRGPRGRGQTGAEGEGVQAENPAEGRYVDLEFKPLSAAKLESSMKGSNINDARLSVAKRMPVQMRLIINQSKINKFLVECGNSDLPLEVRQIRLGDVSRTGQAAMMNNNDTDVSKADIPIEMWGVIYIFNPPNKELLNIKEPDNAATAMNN